MMKFEIQTAKGEKKICDLAIVGPHQVKTYSIPKNEELTKEYGKIPDYLLVKVKQAPDTKFIDIADYLRIKNISLDGHSRSFKVDSYTYPDSAIVYVALGGVHKLYFKNDTLNIFSKSYPVRLKIEKRLKAEWTKYN